MIVPADATVATQLALTGGESVVRIRGVRLADGIPLSFDNLKLEPIVSLLERKYDVPLVEGEYKLDAVPAGIEVAGALKVESQTPIFRSRMPGLSY